MAETFTSAGCGSPTRRTVAILAFAVGALVAASLLGAALGAVGGLLPKTWALAVAGGLAILATLREAGLRGIPLPELRKQVPESWRRTKPLTVWSVAYGAILGAGALTHQAVSTFWVVCAGALAIGDPAVGAACLACFGLARVLMLVVPGGDPIARLSRSYRLVRPANALVLAVCAVLLFPAAASSAELAALPSGQSDPSVSESVIAYTDQVNGASNVVVLAADQAPVLFPGGRLPALNGDTLAYVDDRGIRVVFWRTQQEIARYDGPFTTPALSGPRLAYVERTPTRNRLIFRNISTGTVRTITRVGAGRSIGRPSLFGQLLAWHEQAGDSNRILMHALSTRRTRVMVRGSRSVLTVNPVVTRDHIAWIQGIAERSTVLIRRISGGTTFQVATTTGPRHHFWNLAIEAGRIHVTQVRLSTNVARILRYRWAPLPRPR